MLTTTVDANVPHVSSEVFPDVRFAESLGALPTCVDTKPGGYVIQNTPQVSSKNGQTEPLHEKFVVTGFTSSTPARKVSLHQEGPKPFVPISNQDEPPGSAFLSTLAPGAEGDGDWPKGMGIKDYHAATEAPSKLCISAPAPATSTPVQPGWDSVSASRTLWPSTTAPKAPVPSASQYQKARTQAAIQSTGTHHSEGADFLASSQGDRPPGHAAGPPAGSDPLEACDIGTPTAPAEFPVGDRDLDPRSCSPDHLGPSQPQGDPHRLGHSSVRDLSPTHQNLSSMKPGPAGAYLHKTPTGPLKGSSTDPSTLHHAPTLTST